MSEVHSDDKYIVFKLEDYEKTLFDGRTLTAEQARDVLWRIRVQDAVVIRRQDKFASPCLATYAACIAMVAVEKNDQELLRIADYFEDQARLAADEGYKLPD